MLLEEREINLYTMDGLDHQQVTGACSTFTTGRVEGTAYRSDPRRAAMTSTRAEQPRPSP